MGRRCVELPKRPLRRLGFVPFEWMVNEQQPCFLEMSAHLGMDEVIAPTVYIAVGLIPIFTRVFSHSLHESHQRWPFRRSKPQMGHSQWGLNGCRCIGEARREPTKCRWFQW